MDTKKLFKQLDDFLALVRAGGKEDYTQGVKSTIDYIRILNDLGLFNETPEGTNCKEISSKEA